LSIYYWRSEFNFRDAKQYWGMEDFMNADFRGAKFYNNLGGDGAVLAQKIG
jgi:hypothetical protein